MRESLGDQIKTFLQDMPLYPERIDSEVIGYRACPQQMCADAFQDRHGH